VRSLAITLLILFCFAANSQTLGGNAVYNFLKLPATAPLTAAGGVNVSWKADDVGLAANNPALLDAGLNSQLHLSFTGLPGGIKAYSLTGAYHGENKATVLGGHIYFLDYGSIAQTDAAGNQSGTFHPVDFVVQASAARSYLEHWNYGVSVKLIGSSYGQYRSAALAFDFGVHYTDSAHGFYAALLARNMGIQLKTYAGEGEDLPFDLQIGLTKRLAHAPFGFSLTAQQLQHFNIHYNDTLFNNENELHPGGKFLDKLFNHFVAAAHVYVGANLEATVGYNQLRRSELNVGSSGNGLNGFSMGVRVRFSKLQVAYARANYQRNISYNQLGVVLALDQGVGKNL